MNSHLQGLFDAGLYPQTKIVNRLLALHHAVRLVVQRLA